jgi:transcriptional regulator with XRE-family HTH domain
MEKDEITQTPETASDILIRMMTDEKDGEEFTKEFLKAGFLSSAVDALFHARRSAGLTQAQIAEMMLTKQAAIARLEADTSGKMSLYRFVDFAIACGMFPLEIKLVPLNILKEYIKIHPEAAKTEELYNSWLRVRNQATPQ